MKTPDEIKKGLECCYKHACIGCPYESACIGCPYESDCDCWPESDGSIEKDALAYIQQLEDGIGQWEMVAASPGAVEDMARENAELLKKVEQLQAERDAAVDDIELCDACGVCKHYETDGEDIPCAHCFHINRGRKSFFEWRGVQKEG